MAGASFEIPSFMPALPEIFVLTMACVILLYDVLSSNKNRMTVYLMAQATLFGAAILTFALHSHIPQITFSGSFISDGMSDVLKMVIYLVTAGVFVFSKQYLIDRNLFTGEYFVLALFAVLGMMVMVSAYSMLMLYLGLELLALCLYAMVALKRDCKEATEAAMKYFILGALASGMLLYGMSMIYGATGSLDIREISDRVIAAGTEDKVLLFGIVFLIVGLAFKLGAVPFHMWIPDVYSGAPTAITLFIGTAPKLAAFALVFRILAEGMGGMQVQWQEMLIMLAVISMIVGNLVAIAQTNIKRMLAYSTIAHMGFLLVGILSGTKEGYAAAMFYTIVYAVMSLGAFGMILMMSRAGFEADNISHFKGLFERSPWFALITMVIMLSMAGVPPFLGFWAKFAVLQAVVAVDLAWVAIVAVITSVIGAYYYLRIVVYMFFNKPEEDIQVSTAKDVQIVMSVNGIAVLAFGIFPGALLALCTAAMPS